MHKYIYIYRYLVDDEIFAEISSEFSDSTDGDFRGVVEIVDDDGLEST